MSDDDPATNMSTGTHDEARRYFTELWSKGDPWDLEISALDQERYARMIAILDGRHFVRALEIGCGAGSFTRSLAGVASRIVAMDVAEPAIEQALELEIAKSGRAEFRVANALEHDFRAEEPFDLVVLAEAVYYLGWLYPMFDVAWFAAEIFRATAVGGSLLLANTRGGEGLYSPWLIDTYEDLFENVGFSPTARESLVGEKEGVTFEISICRLDKCSPSPA